MNNCNEARHTFEHAGERLDHILEIVNFASGRGRVNKLYELLKESSPDVFGDIKYSTVKSWFQGKTPPIKKLQEALHCLTKEHPIPAPADFNLVMNWWKMGGPYPFDVNPDNEDSSISGKTIMEIGELYVEVIQQATKLGLDIFDETVFPKDALENIFESTVAYKNNNPQASKQEISDVIFSLICLTRHHIL